jgi:uncharacterized protein (DUF983 family)
MITEHSDRTQIAINERHTGAAMWKGFRCRCPNCGKGKLFGSYLKPVAVCSSCTEKLDGHRSDDLPPYVTIMLVGHAIVPIILANEMSANPWPLWVHFTVWLPLTLIVTLALMQPVKGAIIAMQWAMRLHGFDPRGDYHAKVLGPAGQFGSLGKPDQHTPSQTAS